MKKLIALLTSLVILALPLASCGNTPTPTPTVSPTAIVSPSASPSASPTATTPAAKPIELTYSCFFPATHGNAVAAQNWINEIQNQTGGRVKISFFPGGTLTPADQCYDGVVKGISDIGMTALAYTAGRFPLMEGLDLPLGYPSGAVATQVVNDIYNKYQPAELNDTHTLYLHAHGPGVLSTKTPVTKLEDIKGLTIRCTGLAAKIVTALGGIPNGMPQGDTIDALQKGTVQGTFAPIESLKTWKQAELIKATTDTSFMGYTTTMWVGINKAKWDALPKDIQDIFTRVSKDWTAKHGKVWDDLDVEGRAYTLSFNNQIIKLSPEEAARWTDAVKALPDTYIQKTDGLKLPGKDVITDVRAGIAKLSK
jgi:TRAP-type transport system periplasmic protein